MRRAARVVIVTARRHGVQDAHGFAGAAVELQRQAQEGLVQGRGGAPALELPLTLPFESLSPTLTFCSMIVPSIGDLIV